MFVTQHQIYNSVDDLFPYTFLYRMGWLAKILKKKFAALKLWALQINIIITGQCRVKKKQKKIKFMFNSEYKNDAVTDALNVWICLVFMKMTGVILMSSETCFFFFFFFSRQIRR